MNHLVCTLSIKIMILHSINRRKFVKQLIKVAALTPLLANSGTNAKADISNKEYIETVKGKIKPSKIGITLSHEHVLVDFIGAEKYDPGRWNHEEVIRIVSPYIRQIQDLGCKTLVECTPEYIGRDVQLLKKISIETGINIITNTGYYGAADNKYLPAHVYQESSDQLTERWLNEFENGIGDTGIKPGFMKIGVADHSLSELHKKLVIAAAKTHLRSGMTIASHTGPALPAFEEINLLISQNVSPEAFIWVHAQAEEDDSKRYKAAQMGAWVSIDGYSEKEKMRYVNWLIQFKEKRLLNKVLVSHDAGWYSPGEPEGGDFRPFTDVFLSLIPALFEKGFNEDDINQVFVKNPADAFSIKIRNT